MNIVFDRVLQKLRCSWVWIDDESRVLTSVCLCSPSQLLAHCIMVEIGIMYPTEFTPEVHVAVDKFLASVALALAEKYR